MRDPTNPFAPLDNPGWLGNEWLPTALADPPGDAIVEVGDFCRMRDGGDFGPIKSTHDNDERDADRFPFCFVEQVWHKSGGYLSADGGYSFDITHVRKAVK